jgi:hypothetical protein
VRSLPLTLPAIRRVLNSCATAALLERFARRAGRPRVKARGQALSLRKGRGISSPHRGVSGLPSATPAKVVC